MPTLEQKPDAKPESRTAITTTLSTAVYEQILKEAQEDDRTPAKWVARYLMDRLQEGTLITGANLTHDAE